MANIILKEFKLHMLIKEAVNEIDWKTYANAAKKTGSYSKRRKELLGKVPTSDFAPQSRRWCVFLILVDSDLT